MTSAADHLKTARRLTVTTAVIALSVGAVLLGRGVLADRLTLTAETSAAPVTSVGVARIALQSEYLTTRRFAGQFEALQTTTLAFEEGGTLAEILVDEGDVVAKSDVIARLDTRLLEAEQDRLRANRAAIAAQVELARRTNARQSELRDRGFASNQRVDDTSLSLVRLEAQIAEIDAALAALDVRLSKAILRAPFAGRVGGRLLDVGAIAGPAAPVVTLLENGPILFRAGIDPSQIAAMSRADEIRVTVGSVALTARLDRIAPELDPATRAQTAFFTVSGAAPPAGSAGEVLITSKAPTAMPGAWVPLSALQQGPRGTWQILIVEDGTVAIAAVELVYAAQSSAFVIGTLKDGQAFVTGGTHRVVPGEQVTVLETKGSAS